MKDVRVRWSDYETFDVALIKAKEIADSLKDEGYVVTHIWHNPAARTFDIEHFKS